MAETRILLVDDEEFYLRLFGDILTARNYDIRTARSGEEALSLLARERFDILVTDLLMRGMDGLMLTERVRNSYPWVDVIVITQRDDVRLAVHIMKMGVFEYLVKPVDRDELLLTIDRLMERRRLLDQQNKLLDESMEYLQAQTVYRRCLEILSTLDVENLCEMILRHMCQATGAQGGLLWLTSPEERAKSSGIVDRLNLAGYRGLVALEDFPTTISIENSSFGELFLAGKPFFADPSTALNLAPSTRSKALFVPLGIAGRQVGLLLLLDKLREDFSDRDQNIASTMAEFSAIALKNSRRFQALERIGLRDQTTTAYNLTYFIDYAGKEIYKARRYGRFFSLVMVSIDRFRMMQEHLKAEVCTQLSRQLAEKLARLVRDADILAKVSDHEYYVLLPETDALGARMFIRRCREVFFTDSFIGRMGRDYSMNVTLGSATFPLHGDDFDRLLITCRDEIERSRNSPFRQLHLEDKGFWETVDMLVGRIKDYQVPKEDASEVFRLAEPPDGSSTHGMFSEMVLDGIEEEVATQAADNPERGAILYALGGELSDQPRPVELALTRAEKAKAYVLGRRTGEARAMDHTAVTRVFLEDPMLDRFRLFLALGERMVYAMLACKGENGLYQGFHTSDQLLVENLIVKLQDHYNFQKHY